MSATARARMDVRICREFLIKFHRFLIVTKVTVTIGVHFIEFKLRSYANHPPIVILLISTCPIYRVAI